MIYELKAKARKAGEGADDPKIVPGVVYGPDVKENILIYLDAVEFDKIYEEAGSSAIIKLQVEGDDTEREVIIKAVQNHPVKEQYLHVDFYQIKKGHKIEVEVELEFFGTPPAIKNLNGILVKQIEEVKVKCLPKDIISEIKVDLSGLETFDDKILVRDLKVPETVEVLENEDVLVASISEPRKAEEDKPVEEESAVEEGEAKEGEDKSGEEAKEGADKK